MRTQLAHTIPAPESDGWLVTCSDCGRQRFVSFEQVRRGVWFQCWECQETVARAPDPLLDEMGGHLATLFHCWGNGILLLARQSSR